MFFFSLFRIRLHHSWVSDVIKSLINLNCRVLGFEHLTWQANFYITRISGITINKKFQISYLNQLNNTQTSDKIPSHCQWNRSKVFKWQSRLTIHVTDLSSNKMLLVQTASYWRLVVKKVQNCQRVQSFRNHRRLKIHRGLSGLSNLFNWVIQYSMKTCLTK